MKIIKPNVTEVTDFEGVDNFYKTVARAARICYASDKTTDDKALVERLIKSKHFSPFEHAIIYFQLDKFTNPEIQTFYYLRLLRNKFTIIDKKNNIVAINGRVLIEEFLAWGDDWSEVIEKLDEDYFPEMKKIEIHPNIFKSFIIDTSIGCTREMNRHHDNFYICEQSTRFCNFSKDKFDGEVSFNKPYWYDEAYQYEKEWWAETMKIIENLYLISMKLEPYDKNYPIKKEDLEKYGLGWTTDRARGILPLDTHTRAIYTSTIEEWQHIIDLRLKGTTGKPHGDIMIIAEKINKLINNEEKN